MRAVTTDTPALTIHAECACASMRLARDCRPSASTTSTDQGGYFFSLDRSQEGTQGPLGDVLLAKGAQSFVAHGPAGIELEVVLLRPLFGEAGLPLDALTGGLAGAREAPVALNECRHC